ncbi:MAG TPA: hypothetical protein VKY85_22320 [Candidatus Angelobacter sp.]|nr:hypothetical protein [Candidatus Angelobacter sp.]
MPKSRSSSKRYADKSMPVGSEQPHRIEDGSAEQSAWNNVSATAQTALNFWNAFIRLQSGTDPLDSGQLARLLCIVRAVSWVESQHGTGSGTSASVDPMQDGNPGDSWWKELTDCNQPQDRFVGGTGKPNLNACELPDKAAADPGFPTDAQLSNLTDPKLGHNDPNFRPNGRPPLMSYCWGVPFLIHKINTTVGDPTYQCESLDRPRLVAGAVAYNGGGDPNYETKINNALDMIGCLSLASDLMATSTDPQKIIDICEHEYPANKDDCNKFVKAVSQDLGVTLFQPGDDADKIVQRLLDAADWVRLQPGDGVGAKAKADAGLYVIAELKGADHNPPRKHGHVAVVVSGPLAKGKYPTAYWGSLDGTPGRRQTLNFAWTANDRDKVEYFAKRLQTQLTVAKQLDEEVNESPREAAVAIVRELVQQLQGGEPENKTRIFFPNGIDLIDISIQYGNAKVELKVAGPKSSGS